MNGPDDFDSDDVAVCADCGMEMAHDEEQRWYCSDCAWEQQLAGMS